MSGTETMSEVGFKRNATHKFTFDHNEALTAGLSNVYAVQLNGEVV